MGSAQVRALRSKFEPSRGCSARDHSQVQLATSGQAQTWSDRRPSVYATAGPTTTTSSGAGVQQSGPDLYSQSSGTSPQDARADTYHHDSHTQGTYATEFEGPGVPGHQQYDDVKREQPATSYPGPATSSYDRGAASRNTLHGALGGNQMYDNGYGIPPSTLSKGAFFHRRKRHELTRPQWTPPLQTAGARTGHESISMVVNQRGKAARTRIFMAALARVSR